MNANDVNSVIDNLCNKLGTTANLLVPEMAKYKIVTSLGFAFIGLILLICAVMCFRKLYFQGDHYKAYVVSYRFVKWLQDNSPDCEISVDWEPNILAKNFRLERLKYYDDDTCWFWILGIICTLIGTALFVANIVSAIGWAVAPNARTALLILESI